MALRDEQKEDDLDVRVLSRSSSITRAATNGTTDAMVILASLGSEEEDISAFSNGLDSSGDDINVGIPPPPPLKPGSVTSGWDNSFRECDEDSPEQILQKKASGLSFHNPTKGGEQRLPPRRILADGVSTSSSSSPSKAIGGAFSRQALLPSPSLASILCRSKGGTNITITNNNSNKTGANMNRAIGMTGAVTVRGNDGADQHPHDDDDDENPAHYDYTEDVSSSSNYDDDDHGGTFGYAQHRHIGDNNKNKNKNNSSSNNNNNNSSSKYNYHDDDSSSNNYDEGGGGDGDGDGDEGTNDMRFLRMETMSDSEWSEPLRPSFRRLRSMHHDLDELEARMEEPQDEESRTRQYQERLREIEKEMQMGVSICHPRGLPTILSEVYSTTSGYDRHEVDEGVYQEDIEAAFSSSTQSMGATTEGEMGDEEGGGRNGSKRTRRRMWARIVKGGVERTPGEGHKRSSCLCFFVVLLFIGTIVGIVVWKMG